MYGIIALLPALAFGLLLSQLSWHPIAVAHTPAVNNPDFRAIAADPNGSSIYAVAFDNTLFRSFDEGRTWQAGSRGFFGEVQSIVFMPGMVFLGTSEGLYTSSDRGQTWEATFDKLAGKSVHLITIEALPLLYVATEREIFQCVVVRPDCIQLGGSPENTKFRSLEATANGEVYLGTEDGAVFRFNKNDESWKAVFRDPSKFAIQGILEDMRGRLLILTLNGIYVSEDRANWQASNYKVPGKYIQQITQTSDGRLCASTSSYGIYCTSKIGGSLVWTNAGLPTFHVTALASGNYGILYAVTSDGLFRLAQGERWQSCSQGLFGATVLAMKERPDDAMYIGLWGQGIYRSRNGVSWEPANQGLIDLTPRDIEMGSKDLLYLATTSGGYQLDLTEDGWKAIDALSGQQVYDFELGEESATYVVSDEGVFRHAEAAAGWENITGGLVLADDRWYLAASLDSGIYIANVNGDVYRLDENTTQWIPLNTEAIPGDVRAFEFGPGGALYIGTWGHGVFRTTDRGVIWQQFNNGLNSLLVNTLWLSSDGVLYLGADGGLFRLDPNDLDWSLMDTGLTNRSIHAIAKTSSGILYAGTFRGGVQIYETEIAFVVRGIAALVVTNLPVAIFIVALTLLLTAASQRRGRLLAPLFKILEDALEQAQSKLLVLHDRPETRRTRVLRWLRIAGTTGLCVVAAAVVLGVLATAFPADVKWTQVNTTGFPSGAPIPITSMSPAVDDNSIMISNPSFGAALSVDDGKTWSPIASHGSLPFPPTLFIRSEGKTLFALSLGRIFCSIDGGISWQPTTQVPAPSGLVPHPNGITILALTNGSGLFRTDDNGLTWRQVGSGLANLDISALWVAPDGKSMLAGTSGQGIFRSQDGGENWSPSSQGLDSLTVRAIISGLDGGTVVAATAMSVQRSVDSGQTWQPASAAGVDTVTCCLALLPDMRTIYAGTGRGVYRTQDNGQTWQLSTLGLNSVYVTSLLTTRTGTILAGTNSGVFRSTDGGSHWESTSQAWTDLPISAIAVDYDGHKVWVATLGGSVFRSLDGGDHWRPTSRNPQGIVGVNTVVSSPEGSRVLVLTADGVFLSPDGGDHWTKIFDKTARIQTAPGATLLRVTSDWKTILIATDGRIMRTSDEGLTWQRSDTGLDDQRVTALDISADGDLVLAATVNGGIYRSTDAGISWSSGTRSTLGEGSVSFLEIGANPDVVFAVSNYRVFRSTDGGQQWLPIAQDVERLYPSSVIALPNGKDFFLVTLQGGIFRSQDMGNSWSPVNNGLTTPKIVSLVSTQDGQRLLAATTMGVFRSDDNGNTWRSFSYGLMDLRIGSLVVGASGEDVFAVPRSTDGRGIGVYRTANNGESWQSVGYGLRSKNVHSLALTPDGKSLVATTDSGLERLADNGQSWEPVDPVGNLGYWGNLVYSPDGNSLFTYNSNRIFRSQDGRIWSEAGNGLSTTYVRRIGIRSGGKNLYISTPSGELLRFNGKTLKWSSTPFDSATELLQPVVAGNTWMNSINGRISLSRPGMGWLPLTTSRYVVPQALLIRGNNAVLYSSTGAATLLRADVPLPIIWRTPTTYLALVAVSWRVLYFVEKNAIVLTRAFALWLLLFLGYAYFGVIRPSRFNPVTVLWLLLRPRHLFAASEYKAYDQRLQNNSSLEVLVMLNIPTRRWITLTRLHDLLHDQGAVSSTDSLRTTTTTLVQQGFLQEKNDNYRTADPLLAEVFRQEGGSALSEHLAQQSRLEHPLSIETRRFLEQSGFLIQSIGKFDLLATSRHSYWSTVSPMHVRLVLDRSLDLEEFRDICSVAAKVNAAETDRRSTLVVIDQPPRLGDLHQIFALRANQGLAIIPLPRSIMTQARLNMCEASALKEQLDLYTGHDDLYQVHRAVTDVLSFFGRKTLLADLNRQLTSGSSVIMYGVRKIGKSSILHRLREESNWLVALVDLQGYGHRLVDVYREALRCWCTSLTYLGIEEPFVEALREVVANESIISASTFRVKVRELIHYLGSKPGRPGLVLLLDEMDYLLEQPDYHQFAATLRSIAESPECRGRFAILMAGHEKTINRTDSHYGKRNPFFEFFVETPVGPMAIEDAESMILSIGGLMGVEYDEDAVELMATIAGGHPFLTRQICSQATRNLKRPCRVSKVQALTAVADYLRSPLNYVAESLWRIQAGGPTLEETAILCSLATNQPQTDDTLIPYGLAAQEQYARQKALDYLNDHSLIRATDNGWELTLPLYRKWIRRYIAGLDIPDKLEDR